MGAFYQDDEKIMCEIIDANWGSGVEKPMMFYNESDIQSHSHATTSSIYVYEHSMPIQGKGTGYDGVGREKSLTVDLRCRDRNTAIAQVNELLRVLYSKRRAVSDWDYIDGISVYKKSNYISFYHYAIEFKLKRVMQSLPTEGTL